MVTVNQDYFDRVMRHQVNLRAFQAGELAKILALLETADAETVAKLRDQLPNIVGEDFASKGARWRAMLADIRDTRARVLQAVTEEATNTLADLAEVEGAAEVANLTAAVNNVIPIDLTFAAVPVQQLRAAALSMPFMGGPNAANTLAGWFGRLAAVDQGRLEDAIRQGVLQGETINEIVRRVIGTKAQKFTDGVLTATRRNAEAIVRTGVNHVSNTAREMVWDENDSFIAGVRWVSTLDGRTSAICRARDGKVAPLGSKPLPKGLERLDPITARPPAHVNCRSTTVAFFNGEDLSALLGERPFVRSGKTPKQREVDFRADAKAAAGDRWSTMTAQDRRNAIKSVRSDWLDRNVGRVPAKTNYDEWLRTQPAEFQNSVLGVGKAQLFRNGLKLDAFVDRKGREFSLAELLAAAKN